VDRTNRPVPYRQTGRRRGRDSGNTEWLYKPAGWQVPHKQQNRRAQGNVGNEPAECAGAGVLLPLAQIPTDWREFRQTAGNTPILPAYCARLSFAHRTRLAMIPASWRPPAPVAAAETETEEQRHDKDCHTRCQEAAPRGLGRPGGDPDRSLPGKDRAPGEPIQPAGAARRPPREYPFGDKPRKFCRPRGPACRPNCPSATDASALHAEVP
jgi:hypothetical protein